MRLNFTIWDNWKVIFYAQEENLVHNITCLLQLTVYKSLLKKKPNPNIHRYTKTAKMRKEKEGNSLALITLYIKQ